MTKFAQQPSYPTKFLLSSLLTCVLSACGGGGGGETTANGTSPLVTPGPTPPASLATASLTLPSINKFPWNLETAAAITLKDPAGNVVAAPTCQSADSALIEISADCTKVKSRRIGPQNVTVTGGGYTATIALTGVPQRYWNGQHGAGSVASGVGYSLLALDDGTALAWGVNEYGTLGQNKSGASLPNLLTPRFVLDPAGSAPLTGIRQVTAGSTSAMALSEDGRVWAWGRNGISSLLAVGLFGERVLLPARVKNSANNGELTNVVQVESGDNNQAALLDNGTVATWGYYTGQGDSSYKAVPGLVKTPDGLTNLGNIVAISAGSNFTLGLSADGRVYAWGYDLNEGRLGSGIRNNNSSPLPNTVKKEDGSELTNVVSISAGNNFALALLSDGTVWSWGGSGSGRLGIGDVNPNGFPYAAQVKAATGSVGFLSNIAMVAAGGAHSLALDKNGNVWAWGYAYTGALGDGPNHLAGNDSSLPRAVVNETVTGQLSGVVSIAAGYGTSVALKPDGTVLMWGDNFEGALGRGITQSPWSTEPVPTAVRNVANDGPLKLTGLASYTNILRRAR